MNFEDDKFFENLVDASQKYSDKEIPIKDYDTTGLDLSKKLNRKTYENTKKNLYRMLEEGRNLFKRNDLAVSRDYENLILLEMDKFDLFTKKSKAEKIKNNDKNLKIK